MGLGGWAASNEVERVRVDMALHSQATLERSFKANQHCLHANSQQTLHRKKLNPKPRALNPESVKPKLDPPLYIFSRF